MHTKLPLVTVLVLVLGPSVACLLFWILCHLHLRRRTSEEREQLPEPVPSISHRRDDFRSILLILCIVTLAYTVSAR